MADRGGTYTGQMSGDGGPDAFAKPSRELPAPVTDVRGDRENLGEMTGFVTTGYIDKNGTPYGEAAKFNYLPPGMDIEAQKCAEIHDMPMRRILPQSYPGDGQA